MIKLLLAKRSRTKISWMLMTVMTAQLVCPAVSFGLSSGPVQPEVQGFEPVGTTDMVDLFTGDFVYNIPLMDVEGYPINISYHGGVTMDQEASWVGLGWNITPGAINKGIRGLPDEFNGDILEKELSIRPEITKRLGIGAVVEAFGMGEPALSLSATLGGSLNMSNYRGVSVDLTASGGVNSNLKILSAGLNFGATLGSQTGASINYGAIVGLGITQSVNKDLNAGGSVNLNAGGVYSPRTGLRNSVGLGVSMNMGQKGSNNRVSMSTGTTIPIGLQNYTSAVTNPCYMNSSSGQLKLGGAVFGFYLSGKVSGSMTTVSFQPNGSRKGFGYFNLENSTEDDLLDFSREKDGMFNTTMRYLPQSHLTYDVYSVSGQGTGGSFRPVRTDIGSVFDPRMESSQSSESISIEGGLGNLFSVGGELMSSSTKTESGPWMDYKRPFSKKGTGYSELLYFKEAGELTENNETYLNDYANSTALTPESVKDIAKTKSGSGNRVVRVNHIYTVSGSDDDTALMLSKKKLESYTDTTGFKTYPTVNKEQISRVGGGTNLRRQSYHVNEVVQTQKDGRRYVYGIPVMNNVQREVTFSVDPAGGNALNDTNYLVNYTPGTDDSRANSKGMEHFYTATVTPSYVTAHLLTGVLSADYVDVTGDGVSDDDLGTYTKFNYSRKSKDYRWRAPIESGKAQYQAGYRTDKRDDKASFMIGSREQWQLHSVETKNYVAEFYVSKRLDAKGVMDQVLFPGADATYNEAPYNAAGNANENKSYKLDSIVLFNKHDRFVNKVNAQPIKTVFFTYDYSLCKGVPNSDPDTGKLTLKKIQIRYGRSNLNMSAAYNFKYSDLNPPYNAATKDRWGNYKPNNFIFNNLDFPFTEQSANTDNYASAWSLTEVGLPSGGVIKVDYESDDYAYVQNLPAMEMFKISGMGSSTNYTANNQLYFDEDHPNLYLYFDRRTTSENALLSMKENYLRGTNLLYYNVPVELAPGKFEPIKGYAEAEVGNCPDGIHGYVKLSAKTLHKTTTRVNPVTYAALNVGRYSLPHIFYPGSNPESTDIDNIVAGMKQAIKEAFHMFDNPLGTMVSEGKGQYAQLTKAFMRLTSPGLKKKGGGQRVKRIRFYDNWAAMSEGLDAVYGKEYTYTVKRDDDKGELSSGVASYEPMTGGDELPQRIPEGYTAQEHSNFPPNDPVDLYQEMPLGESFYPSPVVGYSNVLVRSINFDAGRSSQSEDIHDFYTARDFPIEISATPIKASDVKPKISKKGNIEIDQKVTQGFAITLNDMHGKQRFTEHWVYHPGDPVRGRERTSMQQYKYQTTAGELDNKVPAFNHNEGLGQLSSVPRKMGLETDLTIDSRQKTEDTRVRQASGNLNGFFVGFFGIAIPLGYPFEFSTKVKFSCATATKVTQQYGILNSVVSNNEGAVTEVRNEIFDAYTGNTLVTSVNNEFNDRIFSVNYPAYWAYKEMGPSYENHDLRGKFSNTMLIDSMNIGYASRFVNYNPSFSYGYLLPSNMPVARVVVDEDMPKFKIGDEMLLYHYASAQPIRTWTMGYTSDVGHCYLILAPREPYKISSFWDYKKTYSDVNYRVVRSGNRNRLGETIQSYTTMDSANIFPYLNNDLTNVINLNATTYKHHLGQVYAANQVSDSLNPFVTGKVGIYRPDQQIVNLKKRSYSGGTTRNAGVFNTPSYWQTEFLRGGYCPDSVVGPRCGQCDKVGPAPWGSNLDLDSMRITSLGGDSVKVRFFRNTYTNCPADTFRAGDSVYSLFNGSIWINDSIVVKKVYPSTPTLMVYSNGCCCASFWITFENGIVTIERQNYRLPGGGPAVFTTMYRATGLVTAGGAPVATPYRIRNRTLMGKVGHYDGTSLENWVKTQEVSKYNSLGQEIENKEEGIGYNTAVYGYNQTLPVCVARNARHSEVLFEGFEDYMMQLRPVASANMSYMPLYYSPFASFFKGGTALGSLYTLANANATPVTLLTTEDAHTGKYSLKTGNAFTVRLDPSGEGIAAGYSYKMTGNRKYVVSLWLKPTSISSGVVTANYAPGSLMVTMDTLASSSAATRNIMLQPSSPIIEGWQKFEATFDAPAPYKRFQLTLPSDYYYDDIRSFPFESNSKGFVYNTVDRKLAATLDENNYATFYEYDPEGNLVRTKKETEKGILTITESRSTHYKSN